MKLHRHESLFRQRGFRILVKPKKCVAIAGSTIKKQQFFDLKTFLPYTFKTSN